VSATRNSVVAEATLRALELATSPFSAERVEDCIHHSDRGSQYADGRCLSLLRGYQMRVSMGRKATDNAFGERVNGIIKNEYLIPWALGSFGERKKRTKQPVSDYNTKRAQRAT